MKSTEGNQTKQFKDNVKNNKRTERKEQIKKKELGETNWKERTERYEQEKEV